MNKKVPFEKLRGKVLTKIEGMEPRSEEIIFTAEDGSVYMMCHEQDCCENVDVEDVCGDVDDLIGSEILLAEEVVHDNEWPDGVEKPYNSWEPDSFTWTFYKLATRKGYVDIRWFGESTGYYSESVDFIQIAPATAPPTVPPDLQSGGNEYKDLQSDNGIANADTLHDGLT